MINNNNEKTIPVSIKPAAKGFTRCMIVGLRSIVTTFSLMSVSVCTRMTSCTRSRHRSRYSTRHRVSCMVSPCNHTRTESRTKTESTWNTSCLRVSCTSTTRNTSCASRFVAQPVNAHAITKYIIIRLMFQTRSSQKIVLRCRLLESALTRQACNIWAKDQPCPYRLRLHIAHR